MRALLGLLTVMIASAPIFAMATRASANPMVKQAQPAAASTFTLHAAVSGLYPNATMTASVTVDNPDSRVLRVMAAEVVVADASATCTAANLSAQPFTGSVRIPAHGAGAVPITLHMAASAPDACQGATFPLTLRATGELVDRDLAGNPGGNSAGSSSSAPHTMAFTGAGHALALVLIALTVLVIGIVCWVAARERRAERTQS
jgi:hypothetical protein